VIQGGCFCATVRYQIDGSLTRARACHCSRCRKAFSGASSAYAEVADPAQFRWLAGEDKVRYFTSEQGWGLGFCGECGSTLCGVYQGEIHGITLGSVEGDPGVEIEAHYFVDSRAPWDHIGGTAPQFAERDT